jgi:Acyl-coenzyme A:6-aminopenicillanic acid acyl-transferase
MALGRALGDLFGPTVREYIKEERGSRTWQRRTRDAEELLSYASRYFPAYVEELQAYAEAARVSLLDLWTMSIEDELDDSADAEKCTTVITNGGRLIGHNEDWDADAVEDICILKKVCGTVTTLELYYYGSPLGGTALSICSRGYVQGINSLSHTDWRPGVPKIVVARRLSELREADTELDRVLAIPRSSGFAHNLVHHTGAVTAVECSATRQSVHRPAVPFVHTNHMLDPALHGVEGEHDGKSTLMRYDTACTLVHPSMDRPGLARLASDETCGKTDSIFNRNTIARAVVDLDRRVASFWLKREMGTGWIDYPIDFLFENPQPSV